MVKLRLFRVGKKKQPYYRLVAADSRSPRNGRFIEALGHYDPHTTPPTVIFKEEKVKDWLEKGAKPTESVEKLLFMAGIKERPAYPEKQPPAPEAPTAPVVQEPEVSLETVESQE